MLRPLTLRAATLALAATLAAPVAAPLPAQTLDNLRTLPPEFLCKAQAYTTQSTISAQDARARWSGHVRSMYGQTWANWAAARNTSQHVSQQPTGPVYVASGRPCRAALVLH
jgi:hypothetical protein